MEPKLITIRGKCQTGSSPGSQPKEGATNHYLAERLVHWIATEEANWTTVIPMRPQSCGPEPTIAIGNAAATMAATVSRVIENNQKFPAADRKGALRVESGSRLLSPRRKQRSRCSQLP